MPRAGTAKTGAARSPLATYELVRQQAQLGVEQAPGQTKGASVRRFTVSLAGVVVLLVSGLATLGRSTAAQEVTPAAMRAAEHPVVGAWRWNDAPENLLP